eukprot:gene14054-14171_t
MYARLPLDREEGPVLEYSLDDRLNDDSAERRRMSSGSRSPGTADEQRPDTAASGCIGIHSQIRPRQVGRKARIRLTGGSTLGVWSPGPSPLIGSDTAFKDSRRRAFRRRAGSYLVCRVSQYAVGHGASNV